MNPERISPKDLSDRGNDARQKFRVTGRKKTRNGDNLGY